MASAAWMVTCLFPHGLAGEVGRTCVQRPQLVARAGSEPARCLQHDTENLQVERQYRSGLVAAGLDRKA